MVCVLLLLLCNKPSPSEVLKTTTNYVAGRITPGDIVLLHDLSRENVSAALDAADRLTQQGWQFVTVSRLAALSGKEPSAGNIYRSFP